MSDRADAKSAAEHVVFFDGSCALCHSVVRFLIAADRRRLLRYAPIDGETSDQLTRTRLFPDPRPDAVIYLDRSRRDAPVVWIGSDAVFRILRIVGGFWSIVSIFRFVPRFIREGVYRVIARYRRANVPGSGGGLSPGPGMEELFLP